MCRSQHISALILLKKCVPVIYIDAAAVQTLSCSVIHMIVRASRVVAGPRKVIKPVPLCYDYRFTEVVYTVNLADRSFPDAHHVVVEFRDCG